MPKLLPLLLLVICISAQASKHPKTWTAYTSADLFAYSEPVSIKNFARHFDGPLERGDTAFTHDRIEVGVESDVVELTDAASVFSEYICAETLANRVATEDIEGVLPFENGTPIRVSVGDHSAMLHVRVVK